MKSRTCLALAVIWMWLPGLEAETYDLQLKEMGKASTGRLTGSDSVYFGVSAQRFWYNEHEEEDKFSKAVKKEPAKYACNRPLKKVAELGGESFGFVFDSDDCEKQGYHKLYFDFNGNRDLTDDEPVEAQPLKGNGGYYTERLFFPLSIKLKVGDQHYEYHFLMRASSRPDGQCYAQLAPAACREGRISLEGKEHHIAILDYNSNGRFDDQFRIDANVTYGGGGVYAETGDMVVIDARPDVTERYWQPLSGDSRQYLSRLVNIDGRYYTIKVSPPGDKLTLEPSKLATGTVTNPAEKFRAVLYGDEGMLRISGEKGSQVPVPVGDWKLLTCYIEIGGKPPAAEPLAAQDELAHGSGLPAYMLLARGKKSYKPVKVRGQQSTELPFGPPYKPVVEPSWRSDTEVELDLSLVGAGGEVCSEVELRGSRPNPPYLTIVNSKGDIIERGKFEYG